MINLKGGKVHPSPLHFFSQFFGLFLNVRILEIRSGGTQKWLEPMSVVSQSVDSKDTGRMEEFGGGSLE